jgi:ferredoxin
MTKYLIEIDRVECIQCGNCYETDDYHFEADDDYVAQVVGGETTKELSKGTFDDDKMKQAEEAADDCPVLIITVKEVK